MAVSLTMFEMAQRHGMGKPTVYCFKMLLSKCLFCALLLDFDIKPKTVKHHMNKGYVINNRCNIHWSRKPKIILSLKAPLVNPGHRQHVNEHAH